MASWPYNTAAWKRLRAAKLAREPLCEYCPAGEKIKPATQVDHRLAINKGGSPWAWDNLASTCERCHSRKTAYIDRLGKGRVPVKGCDPLTGLPLDRGHWWANEKIAESCPAKTDVPPEKRVSFRGRSWD